MWIFYFIIRMYEETKKSSNLTNWNCRKFTAAKINLPSDISLDSSSRSLNWMLRDLKNSITLLTTIVSRLSALSSSVDLAADDGRCPSSTSLAAAAAGSLTNRTPSNTSISGCSLIRSRAVSTLCLMHGPNCVHTSRWHYVRRCRTMQNKNTTYAYTRLTCDLEQSWNTLKTTRKSPRPVSILRASDRCGWASAVAADVPRANANNAKTTTTANVIVSWEGERK